MAWRLGQGEGGGFSSVPNLNPCGGVGGGVQKGGLGGGGGIREGGIGGGDQKVCLWFWRIFECPVSMNLSILNVHDWGKVGGHSRRQQT